jgi:hypothetical protein
MFTSFIANNEVINKISLLAMWVREKFDYDVRKICHLGPIPYGKSHPTQQHGKREKWQQTHFYLLQLQRNLYFKEKKVLVCCVVMVLTLVCCQLQNTQERIEKYLDSLGSRVGNSLPKLSTVRRQKLKWLSLPHVSMLYCVISYPLYEIPRLEC